MQEKERPSERERRDWIIILIILLLGFLCVILAGERALRFSPSWKLNTNMDSNIDPNSDFLTKRPSGLFEPLDPAILTNAVWVDLYQTPGAVFPANPTSSIGLTSPTPVIQASTTPTALIVPTVTNTGILPTSTFIYYPPTNTPKPPAPGTPSSTPLPSADLMITKTDSVTAINSGANTTYTVRVTNNGPSSVTGAILSDPAASGLSKSSVVCSPTPGQCLTAPSIAQLEGGTFALPALANGQFYEIRITANVTASSGSVTNTAVVGAPTGVNDPNTGNNTATDTDTVITNADLQITKTDNSTDYAADAWKTYSITVYNDGPSDVNGANIIDTFSTNTNINQSIPIVWGCLNCTPILGGIGDINQSVNIPSKSSVTFTAVIRVVASSPSGPLINTATVTAPVGVNDPNTLNNSATDTDNLIVASSFPSGNIGTNKDSSVQIIPAGTNVTLSFGPPLVVGGHLGWDLVYYELPQGANPGVMMDVVILQIGDGSNWYTILNWGDGSPDINTNIPIPLGSPPNPTTCAGEPDNCEIYASLLYNATGIAIDVDGMVPNGTYPYIRIIAPPNPPDVDNQVEVDAIYIVP